jgi:hypothetical protein
VTLLGAERPLVLTGEREAVQRGQRDLREQHR